MTQSSHRGRARAVLLLLGLVMLSLMAGALRLALIEPAEDVSSSGLPVPAVHPTPARATALGQPAPVLTRPASTEPGTETDDAEPGAAEPTGETVRRFGRGFSTRTDGAKAAETRVTTHARRAAWPPRAEFVAPEKGHPERTRVHGHRRLRSGAHESVVVRVFGAEDGARLHDARVELRYGKDPDGDGPRIEDLQMANGRASRDAVTPGPIDVRVFAPGRVPVREASLSVETGQDLVVDVFLERGQVLEGVLYEPGGVRAAGVRVRVWPAAVWWAAAPLDDPPLTLMEATSDAEGNYRIDSVPRLANLIYEASRGGLATWRADVRTGAANESPYRAVGAPPRGVEISGTITGPAGVPIAGAVVFAAREPSPIPWASVLLPNLSETEIAELVLFYRVLLGSVRYERLDWFAERAVTDAGGHYRVTGLWAHQTYQLFARSDGRGLTQPSDRMYVKADREWSGQMRGVSSGDVLVSDHDGEGLLGAHVTLPWAFGTPAIPAVRDAPDGLHGPVAMAVGPNVIRVEHPDHPTHDYAGRVRVGNTDTHVITMTEGFPVRGVVRDRKDRPLAGVRVRVADRDVLTDHEGRFEIRGIERGEAAVRCLAPGHTPRTKTVTVPGEEVEIRLFEWATIRLRLRVPKGAPDPAWVAAASYTKFEERYSEYTRSWDRGMRVRATGEARGPAFTLDWNDGLVELRVDTSWSDRIVSVAVPGYRHLLREVTCRGGETVDLGGIALVPAPLLHGVVVDEASQPVAGAWVDLELDSSASRYDVFHTLAATTDEEGRFEFPLAVDGDYTLGATATGFGVRWIEVTPDREDDELLVQLAREHLVHGRVVDPTGAPVPGAPLHGTHYEVFADDEGRFTLGFSDVPFTIGSRIHRDDAGVLVGKLELWAFPAEDEVIELRLTPDGR